MLLNACKDIGLAVNPRTNQNSVHEEIRFNPVAGNSFYYSFQTLFLSRFFSKNLKIKMYGIILPVVLYGSEAWFLTLREECRLRVFEYWTLRRMFESTRDENGELRRLQTS